ncbi:ABC transporter permease [Acidobacteriota bacterium]
MIKNYLKTAVRNLLKRKSFSFINITGLAVGMAVCFVLLSYVLNEVTYDRFHEKSSRIFRMASMLEVSGRKLDIPGTPAPFGPKLVELYPEIINIVRLQSEGTAIISHGDKIFEENRIYYIDPSFVDVFTMEVISGDPKTFLNAPFSMIVTEEIAEKHFGEENPLGKIIRMDHTHDFTITGVIKKMPENSHIKFNMLGSLSTLEKKRGDLNSWMGFNYTTYLELGEKTSAEGLDDKYQQLLMDNLPDQIKQLGVKLDLELQPLTSIHLSSNLEGELEPPGNISYIRILTAIAIFILLIACINFMNLSTAQSAHRAKEVGMRKVLGAQRRKLVSQFLGESMLLSFISLVIAVLLVQLFLPVFNKLVVKELVFNPLQNWFILAGLFGVTVFVGMASGAYPALFLSSFLPIDVFKARFRAGRGHRFFRNGLVSFQYIISIILICCTLIIFSQLRLIKNHNLGFDKNQIAVIQLRGEAREKHEIFKDQILQIPGVAKAAGSSATPLLDRSETQFKFEGAAEGSEQILPFIDIDEDYLDTMGMEIVAGRNFSIEFPSDKTAVILNEALSRQLGWENPLNKTVLMMDFENQKLVEKPYTVIGVVRDFHFETLHQPIRGHIMRFSGIKEGISSEFGTGRIAIKLRPENISSSLTDIGERWKRIEPKFPFEYSFLDDSFDRLYRSEQRMGKIFIYFTIITILVACLGLFGLASFTTEQRTKEIGIRKILGAPISSVIVLLSKEFTKWVILANIIAWPIAYFAMNKWLQSFAYRVDLHVWMFLLSGIIALVISLLTVSSKTIKAAASNPINSLRYE